MRKSAILVAASALTLSGCGTYSFGPPEVSLSRRVSGQELSQECLIAPAPAAASATDFEEIGENVDGALALVSNFIDAYRCTMRLAADGRQAWQLPGFLALAGSATATAFGGGADWGIAGGAASSMFNAGNAYYNPQEQAAILRDAIEALTCIQTEAVGVSAFSRMPRAAPEVAEANVQAAQAAVDGAVANVNAMEMEAAEAQTDAAAAQNDAAEADQRLSQFTASLSAEALARVAGDAPDPVHEQAERLRTAVRNTASQADAQVMEARRARRAAVDAQRAVAPAMAQLAAARAQEALSEIEITPERQYFNMVQAALLGVEVAAAQRLSSRGTFSAEGVRAQIAALTNQAEKSQELVDNPPPAPPAPPASGDAGAAQFDAARNAVTEQVRWVQLRLDAMQPKLQQCILRAQV